MVRMSLRKKNEKLWLAKKIFKIKVTTLRKNV